MGLQVRRKWADLLDCETRKTATRNQNFNTFYNYKIFPISCPQYHISTYKKDSVTHVKKFYEVLQ